MENIIHWKKEFDEKKIYYVQEENYIEASKYKKSITIIELVIQRLQLIAITINTVPTKYISDQVNIFHFILLTLYRKLIILLRMIWIN